MPGSRKTYTKPKPNQPTKRSQISHVVGDSAWEVHVANILETSPHVLAYAKNDHLGFQIYYLWQGSRRRFVPDFLIRLNSGKTLVLLTFVAGLLPVLGNLISNTVIVVISLGVSPQVAASSLLFLVLVHKLEYLLNAHIIGRSVNASIWEMLLAMITLESLFGLPGLVAAPVLYAYLKQELLAAGLVGDPGSA